MSVEPLLNPSTEYSRDVEELFDYRVNTEGEKRSDVYIYVSLVNIESEITRRECTVTCASFGGPDTTLLGLSVYFMLRPDDAVQGFLNYIACTRQLKGYEEANVHVVFSHGTGLERSHYCTVVEVAGHTAYCLDVYPDALDVTMQMLRTGDLGIHSHFFSNREGMLETLRDQLLALEAPTPTGVDFADIFCLGVYCADRLRESETPQLSEEEEEN